MSFRSSSGFLTLVFWTIEHNVFIFCSANSLQELIKPKHMSHWCNCENPGLFSKTSHRLPTAVPGVLYCQIKVSPLTASDCHIFLISVFSTVHHTFSRVFWQLDTENETWLSDDDKRIKAHVKFLLVYFVIIGSTT